MFKEICVLEKKLLSRTRNWWHFFSHSVEIQSAVLCMLGKWSTELYPAPNSYYLSITMFVSTLHITFKLHNHLIK